MTGAFGAPDRGYLVSLEGHGQVTVLRRHASQRERKVIPQAHVSTTVVGESEEKLFGVCTVFPKQYLRVFERGRAKWRKAVPFKHCRDRVDHPLTGDHFFGEVIAESPQHTGLDQCRRHRYACSG
ncbi:MAG: hypothetical protein BWY06_00226 [Candidatus Latescibacteria bacterium ADurb.Bin168]|nr:MAG: hypothetical protein BWY06_00226 [Candidatus Latescibacteria bacterium ADurb.Bin168]